MLVLLTLVNIPKYLHAGSSSRPIGTLSSVRDVDTLSYTCAQDLSLTHILI